MRKAVIVAMATLVISASSAFADPTGSFDVKGQNADSGDAYSGTVKVARHGETYKVMWDIGGDKFYGTGLGAKFVGNRFEFGSASADDVAISVGYVSNNSFGIAMFFKQPDGHWEGAWTYGGSKTVAREDWYPK